MKRRNLKQYRNPGDGGLYFVSVGPNLLHVRIGISGDVRTMVKNLRRRNPNEEVELWGWIPGGDRELEDEIHRMLREFHLGDGLFELNSEVLDLLDWFDEDDGLRGIEADH